MYVYGWIPHRSQRVSDSLELVLQVVVVCLIWVLGTKLVSTERVANTPNH